MAIVKSISSVRQANDGGDSSPESVSVDESDESSGDLSYSTSDSDSAMGSDSLDLMEIGEAGTELCQVANHTVSLPLDLYDLPDLTQVLNFETWNECLSEEERFALCEFLPDIDQETFARTLKELFSGKNFHFGSPISDLFTKLKAGVLDPRIVLHRRGLNSFKRREHYHLLRKYQNSMVGSFRNIRDAWRGCSGYGIEERLRLLNILRSRRSLGDVGGVVSEADSESGESAEELRGRNTEMEHRPRRFVKDSAKGILKVKNESSLFGEKGKARKELLGFPMRAADGYNEDRNEMMAEQCFEMDTGARLLRPGKKESFVGTRPYDQGRGVNQGVTIASYNPHSLETMSKARYSGKDWMYQPKDRSQHQLSVGSQTIKSEEWNVRGKKFKGEDDFRSGTSKAAFDPKARSYNKAFPAQMGDPYSYFDHRAKMSQEKIKNRYDLGGRIGTGLPGNNTAFSWSEDTESDSSDQVEEDADAYSFGQKVDYLGSAMEGQQVKPVSDLKKSSKLASVDIQHSNIISHEPKPIKAKKKSKMNEPSYLQDVVLVKKSPVPRPSEKVQQLSLKANVPEKKRKGSTYLDHFSEPLPRDYDSSSMNENAEYFDESSQFFDSRMQGNGSGNKSNMPLLMCNSVMKKWKGNVNGSNQDDMEEAVYLQYSPVQRVDEPNFIRKKAKRKTDTTSVATPDPIMPEQGTEDVEPEAKPQKKTFTLITPTKHTGFSFSIIHLLSAVRKAMITPPMEDVAEISNHFEKGDDGLKQENMAVNETRLLNIDITTSKVAGQNNLSSLTVQDIVNRVRTNPGDPCILETQEPLQDLVRGVLKIFSSKTAPLGAKGWKVLVSYEKSNKSWWWVGPVSSSSSDNDAVEEETSSETWGIPHKMLVKLVDAFANWLKSGQETLRQIGSLPAPPIVMLPELDEKERFRDLRAQKSLNTISASSEEVRAYFRKEELLRYMIPDRAFSYTAADGKKSIVAPLRRGGGKPTSKARDHFMLKPDRPPHVTILCLVRDAAARLPGSIGTRADVCTLIRDSQYIVESVTDAQVNQVVSGALDRLHYERDPCVQFDSERKLWVYLHRDREEEDFEDDGTSSTKKWKRQRKDATDQSNTGATNDVSYHATGDPAGGGSARFDFNPDLNVDSSSLQAGLKSEPMYNGLRSNMDNFQPLIDQSAGYRGQDNPMGWEALGPLNAFRENKMICQENSAKGDFDEKLVVEKDQLEF